jgi:hypothetical protein
MEMEDINNKLIVTIAIQLHGSVFTFELTNETSRIFENVRLLCATEGFTSYESNLVNELVLVKGLRKYFANNIDDLRSTFNMLNETQKGMLFGNITFDKLLSTTTADSGLLSYLSYTTYLEGVYLISLHKGKELLYPKNPNDIINLLYVNDLFKLSELCKTEMPDIPNLSSEFPNIKMYIDKENSIKNTPGLSENEKIKKIEENKEKLNNSLNVWNLTLDNSKKKIEIIKLSVLVEVIKMIISKNCIINLLDYSCSNPSRFISKEQKDSSKYAMKYDIEQGIPYTKLGGKKYSRKKYKKKRNTQKRRGRKNKNYKNVRK